jgi:hypothetical protein
VLQLGFNSYIQPSTPMTAIIFTCDGPEKNCSSKKAAKDLVNSIIEGYTEDKRVIDLLRSLTISVLPWNTGNFLFLLA